MSSVQFSRWVFSDEEFTNGDLQKILLEWDALKTKVSSIEARLDDSQNNHSLPATYFTQYAAS